MLFGWHTLNIDNEGLPTEEKTDFEADCFCFAFWVLWIDEIKKS